MDGFLNTVRSAIVDLIRSAKKQRAEVTLFVFCNLLIFAVFLYGAVVLLPAIVCNSSWPVYLINYMWTGWVVMCILSNYHLIRIRNSSIKTHILIPPPHDVVEQQKYVPPENADNVDLRQRENSNDLIATDVKSLAEHFTSRPFNSDLSWHICGACEAIVPPRSWHCNTCDTCIFRRDHHCIFAAGCIGEDNQCNFLGFLVYLSAGSLYASVLFYVHLVHVLNHTFWMWVIKCLFSVYTWLLWDFSLEGVFATVSFATFIATTGIFVYYIMLAFKGQTSADSCRKIAGHSPGEASKFSNNNLVKFLGPNPIRRILWPFHEVIPHSYDQHQRTPATPKEL